MMRNAYKMLVLKPEGKRPFGIPGCRWEGNIKKDRNKMGLVGVDWIHLGSEYGSVAGSCQHGVVN
jgi:hypothetical protein